MPKKPTKAKGAAVVAPDAQASELPARQRSAETLLERFDRTLRGSERELLFRCVADRVRSCMLDPSEAHLVAAWFERIADGEDPKRVLFGETRGRKRGATGAKYVRGTEVRLPDHVDLCWGIRRALAQHDAVSVFSAVAKCYSVTPEYVRQIWEDVAPTLGPDPGLLK